MLDQTWPYDLIAEVYATDMGRSMLFDDAGSVVEYALLLAAVCSSSAVVLDARCSTSSPSECRL
ncbi:MAG: hypothetical protein NT024_00410 [Proteobacteria bacterium]|nr:hypothetical protein [Pseudomonadota bacterium]